MGKNEASAKSSGPALPQERPELLGVGAPEADQPGEDAQRLRSEMVLDHFDLLLDGLGAQAEELEQFRQRVMPHRDVLGHGATPGGQCEARYLS